MEQPPTVRLEWFAALPPGLALRLSLFYMARKVLRIPAFISFAQGAEDLLIRTITSFQIVISDRGYYVDVGCNQPVTDSNTFDLYLRGWRGINIDANRELIGECRAFRKKDVSICAAVSNDSREATFHKSKTHMVSTIDEKRLAAWKDVWEFSDDDIEVVQTRTLTSILDEWWEQERSIDLLSIDVEGQDFEVLLGLDFTRYRPKIIVIETYEFDGFLESGVYRFLSAEGYSLKHLAYLNAFFVDARLNPGGQTVK